VTDEHRQRWPDAYAAFKRQEEISPDGTPLEQWPILNRGQVLELKAVGIMTVEQCAHIPDNALHRLPMGARSLRDRAQAYLDDAASVALTERLNRENELASSRIAALERQIQEQGELINRLSSQMMAAAEAPSPVATFMPAQQPAPAFQLAPAQPASSLDALPPVKRGPGRPRREEPAAA
jgi:hypothetical protein